MQSIKEEFKTWFEDIDKEVDFPCNIKIGYLRIAFHWGFFYLKKNIVYKDAIKDILSKGGDTDTNAAIVGGLLGAQGIKDKIPIKWLESVMKFDPTDISKYSIGR